MNAKQERDGSKGGKIAQASQGNLATGIVQGFSRLDARGNKNNWYLMAARMNAARNFMTQALGERRGQEPNAIIIIYNEGQRIIAHCAADSATKRVSAPDSN